MANAPVTGPTTTANSTQTTTRTGKTTQQATSSSSEASSFQSLLEESPAPQTAEEMTPAQHEVVTEAEDLIQEVEEAIEDVEDVIEVIAADEEMVENVVGQQQLEKAREIVEETKEKLEEIKEDVEEEPYKLTQKDINGLRKLVVGTVNVGGKLTTFYGSSVTTATGWVTGGVSNLVQPQEDDSVSRYSSVVETDGQPGDGYYMTGVGVFDAATLALDGTSEIPKNRAADQAQPRAAGEGQMDAEERISPTGFTGSSATLKAES